MTRIVEKSEIRVKPRCGCEHKLSIQIKFNGLLFYDQDCGKVRNSGETLAAWSLAAPWHEIFLRAIRDSALQTLPPL